MGKLPFFPILLITLLPFQVGCNKQDTEALRSIGKKVVERADILTENLQDGLGNRLPGLGHTPAARVAARLRWEKMLAEDAIEVHGQGGAVELTGKVHSEEQRRRAVELAETTHGVESVTNSLELVEPAS